MKILTCLVVDPVNKYTLSRMMERKSSISASRVLERKSSISASRVLERKSSISAGEVFLIGCFPAQPRECKSNYGIHHSLSFIFLALIFAGCTSAKYQEMQNERQRLRAAHEDARRKTDSRPMEEDLTQKLLGSWQFLGIEVAEGDLSEEINALKYELHETARENLTLEFFMDQNVYRRYRGKNGSTEVTGSFKIDTRHYGDVMLPYLRVFRDTSERFPEFISGTPPNRLVTKDNPAVQFLPLNWLGISITEDRLELTLYGVMELTPSGWAQNRGVHCTFKRIK